MKKLALILLLALPAFGQFRIVDQGKPNGGGLAAWPVTCVSGCGTAAAVLMGDGTANPTIPQSAVFNMVWNTVTWDRLRGDTTNGVWANIKSSVVLHAIIDSGSTVVTQGTAANLNATVVQGTAAASTAGWPGTLGQTAATTAAWTSATTVDTTLSLATTGYGTVLMTNDVSGTVASASFIFEASRDGGTTWRTIFGTREDSITANFVVSVVTATVSTAFTFNVAGFTNIRVRLNPAITNTGTATVGLVGSAASMNPSVFSNITNVAGSVVVTGGTGGTIGVGGTQANNAAITANPMLVGVETITSGTNPVVSTTGNIRREVGNLEGTHYVQLGGANQWSCFLEAITVTTQCHAAPAAGLRSYVTSVNISNEAATVQTVDVIYGTGAACATGITALTHKFQMGTVATTTSPFVINAVFPNPLVPAAASAICVRPSAATAFGVTLSGFDAP